MHQDRDFFFYSMYKRRKRPVLIFFQIRVVKKRVLSVRSHYENKKFFFKNQKEEETNYNTKIISLFTDFEPSAMEGLKSEREAKQKQTVKQCQ